MTDAVPSMLVHNRFERACGVPSTIQLAGMGAGRSSTSSRRANSAGPGTACSKLLRRAFNRGTAEESVNSAGAVRLARRTVDCPACAKRPIAPSPAQPHLRYLNGHRPLLCLACTQVQTPLFVDAERGRAPRALQARLQAGFGEFRHQPGAPVGQRLCAKRLGERRRFAIEIAEWQSRKMLALAGKVARRIAAIFAKQCIGLVFRMTLEEQKEAAVLFGESIDTRRL